uniref:Uncharacterized protein n=1 Tax=Arundo donax TaxID=35708 RepID=A0A0A8ZXF8_ARUDO
MSIYLSQQPMGHLIGERKKNHRIYCVVVPGYDLYMIGNVVTEYLLFET